MSNSLNQNIDLVEKLYYKGKFSDTINEIMNLKKIVKRNQQEYYQLLVWENKIRIKLGNYSEALPKMDNLITSIEKKNFLKLVIESILVKVSLLEELGNYELMISTINQGESLIKKLDDIKQIKLCKSLFSYKKGCYYQTKGEYKTAESLLDDSLEMCNELKNNYTKAEILIYLSSIYRKRGEKESAIKSLNESLQICNENEYNLLKGRVFSAFGHYYNLEGNLPEALTYLQQSSNLFNEIGSIYELGQININLGVINHFSGNLNSALSYYLKALEYFQIVGDKNSCAATKYNIGIIYNLQGKLKDALESYESSLPIFQEQGNISQITACFNSIGKIFFDLGLLERAENHLRLVYQLKDQITKVSLSKTLFYLIPVLINQNNLDESKRLINELEKISDKEDSEVIKHRYLFLKALTQSLDENINFKEIEKLYLQVINEPVTDQETKINAIINYSHLLIKEYIESNNEEVLDRIKYNNERLSKLATKQQSKLLFVEFYWIKSIIASFEGDKTSSEELSTQAQKMAKEMNFIRFLNKMKNFTLKY